MGKRYIFMEDGSVVVEKTETDIKSLKKIAKPEGIPPIEKSEDRDVDLYIKHESNGMSKPEDIPIESAPIRVMGRPKGSKNLDKPKKKKKRRKHRIGTDAPLKQNDVIA